MLQKFKMIEQNAVCSNKVQQFKNYMSTVNDFSVIKKSHKVHVFGIVNSDTRGTVNTSQISGIPNNEPVCSSNIQAR